MSKEAMQMALEALETNNEAWKQLADSGDAGFWEAEEQPFYELSVKAITALRQALEKPKYRRGDRLLCRETEEYCVIHIGGTDRQYVKFPGGFVGEYTNAQIDELFELLPKEVDQREWVGLTAYEIQEIHLGNQHWGSFACAIEQALKEKNHG